MRNLTKKSLLINARWRCFQYSKPLTKPMDSALWHTLPACENTHTQAGSLCHYGRFSPNAHLICDFTDNDRRNSDRDEHRAFVAPSRQKNLAKTVICRHCLCDSDLGGLHFSRNAVWVSRTSYSHFDVALSDCTAYASFSIEGTISICELAQ